MIMMRLFKKKARNRKVFGFLCDQGVAQYARLMAKAMGFPIYVLTEHALQIGFAEITPLLNDEKAREKLEYHLRADHLLPPNLGKPVTDYDKRFLSDRKKDVIKQLIEAEMTSEDVQDASNYLFGLAQICGIKPLFLIGFLQELLLRDKYPSNWSTPYNPNRSVNYIAKSKEENAEDEFCVDDGPEEE